MQERRQQLITNKLNVECHDVQLTAICAVNDVQRTHHMFINGDERLSLTHRRLPIILRNSQLNADCDHAIISLP